MTPRIGAMSDPVDLSLPPKTTSTYRSVLPLLWPEGRADLRTRVVLAFIAMFAAKAFTVYAPFFYRDAVDALTTDGSSTIAIVAVPVAMVVAYGVARIMMIAMAQLRDGLFARVGQNAVRTLALRTFKHIHALSLRFHLERRTGGLSRIIERGTKAIEFLLRFSLFSIFPTIIELLLVAGILWWNFDWRYAAVTGGVISLYIAFTYWATEWRTAIRREMNDRDTEANTKAIDSL
ncbi:MAG TPA: metal ABC transporter permease, partial [Rhodobiaceae bacterium]|nr:metal ABC transporter permease [Rhodobiaceae bacterium]